jgi:hypothetical protein
MNQILMNQQTLTLAIFVVLSAVLVTGLLVMPLLEEAQAKHNNYGSSRYSGVGNNNQQAGDN